MKQKINKKRKSAKKTRLNKFRNTKKMSGGGGGGRVMEFLHRVAEPFRNIKNRFTTKQVPAELTGSYVSPNMEARLQRTKELAEKRFLASPFETQARPFEEFMLDRRQREMANERKRELAERQNVGNPTNSFGYAKVKTTFVQI